MKFAAGLPKERQLFQLVLQFIHVGIHEQAPCIAIRHRGAPKATGGAAAPCLCLAGRLGSSICTPSVKSCCPESVDLGADWEDSARGVCPSRDLVGGAPATLLTGLEKLPQRGCSLAAYRPGVQAAQAVVRQLSRPRACTAPTQRLPPLPRYGAPCHLSCSSLGPIAGLSCSSTQPAPPWPSPPAAGSLGAARGINERAGQPPCGCLGGG